MDTAKQPLPPQIIAHYEGGVESNRLRRGSGRLELARTQELLQRYLPPPPAVVVDVGGGPGVYACWLSRLGYRTHLLDPVPSHIAQATLASERQPENPLAGITLGDARSIPLESESADAVLLLGPLYHLTEREDRLAALREALRVLKRGGRIFAVGISRFASVLDGMKSGYLSDPVFAEMWQRDVAEGQHRNPTDQPRYFTTAFFHHPTELKEELSAFGFEPVELLAIEGPAWLLQNFEEQWSDPAQRERLLVAVRAIETEPSLMGASAHLLAIGNKSA